MSITVWDLDSTIADTSPRHHLSPFENPLETWDSYAKACSSDLPMRGTIYLMRSLYRAGEQIHIVTGRRVSAFSETVEWLSRYEVPWHVIRMRQPGDPEPNTRYKIEYMKSLSELPSLFVSDWSPECQDVRKELGIAVVCINPEYPTLNGADPTMAMWDNPSSDMEVSK